MADPKQPRERRGAAEAGELRRQAEGHLGGLSEAAAGAPLPEDAADLVHELRVHQIELEMQNEELRRAQLELEEQRAKYFELFDLAPVGYLTLDDRNVVRDANLTAALLLGVERQQLVEQPITAFILADDQDVYYRHRRQIEQSGAPLTCELRLRHAGGEPFWAYLSWQTQPDGGDAPPLYHLTFTDVHQRVLAEEALRESEALYRSILSASPDDISITDLEGRLRIVSPAALAMFGYEREEQMLGRALIEFLVPEDRERAETSVALMHQGVLTGPGDYRGVRADGTGFAVEVNGEFIRDADERPTGMVFIARDVTARKRMENELRETRDYLENLLSHGNAPIIVWDPELRITSFNRAFEELTGRTAQEVVGAGLELLFPDERRIQALALVTRATLGERWEVVEIPILRADGEVRTVLWNSATVYAEDGTMPVATIAQGQDITKRKQAEEKLARLNQDLVDETAALAAANATITRIAATDQLTGLANRRQLFESLEKALSLARRHGSPLALVSLDLDGLKHVNDTAGHEAGDEVLKRFASLLSSLCRAEDLPTRLGGDEFSVLLPGIDLAGARGFAERVLVAVRSSRELEQQGTTVSGGVAQWSRDDLPVDLLRRADQALYAAKHKGGDAVAVDGLESTVDS